MWRQALACGFSSTRALIGNHVLGHEVVANLGEALEHPPIALCSCGVRFAFRGHFKVGNSALELRRSLGHTMATTLAW